MLLEMKIKGLMLWYAIRFEQTQIFIRIHQTHPYTKGFIL